MIRATLYSGMFAGAVLLALVSVVCWPPRLGVDLGGGVRWIYRVDRQAMQTASLQAVPPEMVDWDSLVHALQQRIDPLAFGDCRVRALSDGQIEIIASVRDDADIVWIRNLIAAAGVLEFRAVANQLDHHDIIELAREQATSADQVHSRRVWDGERPVGFWARVGRQNVPGRDGIRPLSVHVAGDIVRDAATGQILEVPLHHYASYDEWELARYFADREVDEIEVLLAVDDGFDVTGDHIAWVSQTWDESARPCVNFTMTSRGAKLMLGLTGTNLPDPQREFYRRLGIMLDGTLLSAPRVMSAISDRGRITGEFTEEQTAHLVAILRAGSLPAPLQSTPVSETFIAPDARATGRVAWTLWISLGIVLVVWIVLLLRHGLCGLGGCLASLLQILLTLTAVLLLRLAVSPAVVLAAAVVAVLAALGSATICHLGCPGRTSEPREPGHLFRRLGLGAAITGIVFGSLLMSSIVLYSLGSFPARDVATIVLVGSVAALASSMVCLTALGGESVRTGK
jgi:SecD/SecF fusion protein